MNGPGSTLLLAATTLLLLTAYGVHRWRHVGYQEAVRLRIAGPPKQPPRWARSDALLERMPPLRALGRRARDAALPLGVTDLLLLSLLAGVVTLRVLTGLAGPTLARPLTVVGIPIVLWVTVDGLAQRRRARVVAQIPDLVRLLAGGAKSGLSMGASLSHAVDELGEPTSSELARALTSVEFGRPLGAALEEFAARLGSREFDILTSAIIIQQRSGGDLVALLTRLGLGLQTVRRGQLEVRGITGGLMLQAYLTALMGLLSVIVLNQITGGGLERALDRRLLAIAFAVCASLIVAAVLLVRRIVRVQM